ncbi:MAG: ABC transporter permease [Eubacterium sp.]|nr:ABC transporter permease [Eubacterium sp.]
MYIFKNAMKNISRSLGRNILIGIIVTVIAAASCVALSIRKSSEEARENNMKSLNIVANINVDRAYIMETIQNSGVNMNDRSAMQEVLKDAQGMTIEEMQEYAKSEYVQDFYYSNMVVVNGNDDLQPLDMNAVTEEETTEEETTEELTEETTEEVTTEQQMQPDPSQMQPGMDPSQMQPGMDPSQADVSGDQTQQMPQDQSMQGGMGMQQQQDPSQMLASMADFKITGYSQEKAMEDFVNGVSTITEGQVFEENTENYECIISSELSTYNSLSVGDKITVCNLFDEEETYELEIVGIYKNSNSSTSTSTGNANDPANNILTSTNVVDSISAASEEAQEEENQRISKTVTGSFVFADMNGYDGFASYLQDKEDGKYVLTSSDVASYEASLVPLENLKSFATAFLLIILAIGAIILVVLNMFNIRERKYEVGVLTAIGMHKAKVAWQFILEIFIVTIVSILIGTGIGAASSVPITNKLLESQVEQEQTSSQQQQSNFGRQQQGQFTKGGDVKGPVNYVDSVSYAVDVVVVLQMVGIGILLSIISSLIAIIFIMRYQPLKILTERD